MFVLVMSRFIVLFPALLDSIHLGSSWFNNAYTGTEIGSR